MLAAVLHFDAQAGTRSQCLWTTPALPRRLDNKKREITSTTPDFDILTANS